MKIYRIAVPVLIMAGIAYSCDKSDNTLLQANFEADSQEVVIGEKVQFRDLSLGNPTSWTWRFNGGDIDTSILTSPSVTYTKVGKFPVSLVVRRKGQINEIDKTDFITVNWPTDIKADFSVDKSVATDDETVVFTDRSSGYPSEWSWKFVSKDTNKEYKSSEQNPKMKFTPGIYTVSLTVSNPAATNTKTMQDILKVIDKNAISAVIGAKCRDTYSGGKISFMDKSLGLVESWSWTFEGGTPATSTEQNPIVQYNTPGKYKVTLKVANSKNSSTIEKTEFVRVLNSQGILLWLPFDKDAGDIGPYKIPIANLVQGTGVISFGQDSHFNGNQIESEERGSALFFGGDKANYSILAADEEALASKFNLAGDYSISFWMKVDRIPDGKKYAVFHQGAAPGTEKATRQAWFRLTTDKKHAVFCVEYSKKPGNWCEYQGDKRYDDGMWHHYVCVYKLNDSGLRDSFIYVDGLEIASAKGKADKVIEAAPYYIGCNYRYTDGVFAPENFMHGNLDDYILFNRALSVEEISSLNSN